MRALAKLEDRLFDFVNGIDTRGITYKNGDSNGYEAVHCRTLRRIFKAVRELGVHPDVFVDLGSGKGKACLYAALHGWAEVYGIENNLDLVRKATENHKRFNKLHPQLLNRVRFIIADAAGTIPLVPGAFVFIFNSFSERVLRDFLTKNSKRVSYVAYVNDVIPHVIPMLREFGFEPYWRHSPSKSSIWHKEQV